MRTLHLAILSGCLAALALAEAGEKCQKSSDQTTDATDAGKATLARQLSSFEAYLGQDADKRPRNENPDQSSNPNDSSPSDSTSKLESTGRGFNYHPAAYGPYYQPVQPSYLGPHAPELRPPAYRPGTGYTDVPSPYGYHSGPLLSPYQVAPLYYELLEYKRPYRMPGRRYGPNRYGGNQQGSSYKNSQPASAGYEPSSYQTPESHAALEQSPALAYEEQQSILPSTLSRPLAKQTIDEGAAAYAVPVSSTSEPSSTTSAATTESPATSSTQAPTSTTSAPSASSTEPASSTSTSTSESSLSTLAEIKKDVIAASIEPVIAKVAE